MSKAENTKKIKAEVIFYFTHPVFTLILYFLGMLIVNTLFQDIWRLLNWFDLLIGLIVFRAFFQVIRGYMGIKDAIYISTPINWRTIFIRPMTFYEGNKAVKKSDEIIKRSIKIIIFTIIYLLIRFWIYFIPH